MTDRRRTPFGFSSTANEVIAGVDLSGKRALVTGASSGIGVETARALASAGASVVIAVRNRAKGEEVAVQLPGDVSVGMLELSDLESVAAFVAGWSGALHILVNNAGIMAVPERELSAQGHELQFATNFLGHFALTTGLHGALAEAGGARIVSLSSNAHMFSRVVFEDVDYENRPYDPWSAYGQSKTADILLAVEATRRWSGEGIYANALNPGAIATGLQVHTGGLKTPVEKRKTIEQGASTSVLLAASPLVDGVGGRYFENCNEAEVLEGEPERFGGGVKPYALDPGEAERLWEVASGLVT